MITPHHFALLCRVTRTELETAEKTLRRAALRIEQQPHDERLAEMQHGITEFADDLADATDDISADIEEAEGTKGDHDGRAELRGASRGAH
jgi:hypothetical protein